MQDVDVIAALQIAARSLALLFALAAVVGTLEARLLPGAHGVVGGLTQALSRLARRAPARAGQDALLHVVAPVFAGIPPAATIALLPLTTSPARTTLTGAPLSLVVALPLLSTASIALAGVASGNRLALVDAMRAALARAAVLAVCGAAGLATARAAPSLLLVDVVHAQTQPLGSIPLVASWGIVASPLSALAALGALALLVVLHHRRGGLIPPWHIEASGPVLVGIDLFIRFDLAAGAATYVVLFLGGAHMPGLVDHPLIGFVVVLTKAVLVFVAMALLARRSMSLRAETLVAIALTTLLPLAIAGALLRVS